MSEFSRVWSWVKTLEPGHAKPLVVPPAPAAPAASVAGPDVEPAVTQFDASLIEVLKWEGGLDDDPQDPGGRTAYGITQTDWNEWCTEHAVAHTDVWTIDAEHTRYVYADHYWKPLLCDGLHPATANCLFDYAVNSGRHQAIKDGQRVAGVTPDGVIGPATVAAFKRITPHEFIVGLSQRRLSLLRGLATWDRFGHGWSARVAGVQAYSLSLIK